MLGAAIRKIMGEFKPRPPEEATEERTEPFTPSEIDSRYRAVQTQTDSATTTPLPTIAVPPLDVLHVEERHHQQGVRILVRPLTTLPGSRSVSPGADNCRWLALRAEVASSEQPEHKVLAVTQTCRDIKFSVRIPGESYDDATRPPLWCELYYDPASDKVIILNRSNVPISLVRVSQSVPASPSLNDYHIVNPGLAKALAPGTWRIKVKEIDVLDFRILEKRPTFVYDQQPIPSRETSSLEASEQINSNVKRSLTTDEDNIRVKRRISDLEGRGVEDNAVMFMPPSASTGGGTSDDRLVFSLPNGGGRQPMPSPSKELSSATTNPLLETGPGDTVIIPAVCELDEYHLTKRDVIASTAQSAVYTAHHSSIPGNIVTVKVLKTVAAKPGDKPYVHERNVIRQADMWLRESRTQKGIENGSIVRYYGGDARFLSLYMEHVDAKDLAVKARWRSKTNDEFMGTREDTKRILKDIAEALSYIHIRDLVHNDIKPANILYSPERGAVLCDFGMSTPTASPPAGGGTPYYIPPEFIGLKHRGPPSDVWAMGVTLLYMLRKIPLPESRSYPHHPKRLYWLIAGVNNPQLPHQPHGNGQPAVHQMRSWLTEMYQAREALDKNDVLERLAWGMLTPNAAQRTTMVDVLRELQAADQAEASDNDSID